MTPAHNRRAFKPTLQMRCGLLLGALLVLLTTASGASSGSPRVVAIALVAREAHGSALTSSRGRKPVLLLRQGEDVELRWSSDRSMALHLHGYDLQAEVGPGRDAVMVFGARFAGRFPIETHDAQGRHEAILYVEVHPQ